MIYLDVCGQNCRGSFQPSFFACQSFVAGFYEPESERNFFVMSFLPVNFCTTLQRLSLKKEIDLMYSAQGRNAPNFVNIPVLEKVKCFGISGISWNVLECFGMFWNVMECY